MVSRLDAILIIHTTMENDRANSWRLMLVIESFATAGTLAPPLLHLLAGSVDEEEGLKRSYPRFRCPKIQELNVSARGSYLTRCCPSSL